MCRSVTSARAPVGGFFTVCLKCCAFPGGKPRKERKAPPFIRFGAQGHARLKAETQRVQALPDERPWPERLRLRRTCACRRSRNKTSGGSCPPAPPVGADSIRPRKHTNRHANIRGVEDAVPYKRSEGAPVRLFFRYKHTILNRGQYGTVALQCLCGHPS